MQGCSSSKSKRTFLRVGPWWAHNKLIMPLLIWSNSSLNLTLVIRLLIWKLDLELKLLMLILRFSHLSLMLSQDKEDHLSQEMSSCLYQLLLYQSTIMNAILIKVQKGHISKQELFPLSMEALLGLLTIYLQIAFLIKTLTTYQLNLSLASLAWCLHQSTTKLLCNPSTSKC